MKKALFIFLIIIIAFSCKKIDTDRTIAITTVKTEVNGNNFSAVGNVIDEGEGIEQYGFCWAKHSLPTINETAISKNTQAQTGVFSLPIMNLEAGQTYYIRAYAKSGNEMVYGNELQFTPTSSAMQINTFPANILTISTVDIAASISHPGSLSVLEYGHCWSANSLPDINNSHTNFGALDTAITFHSQLTSLQVSMIYNVRAYCKLAGNTYLYSNNITFFIPELAVTTDTFAIVNATEIKLIGNIVELGIPAVTDHGFCWSTTTSNPTINNNKLSLGAATQIGIYNANLSSLQSGVTYYYRAYATDGNFVKYGVVKKY